MQPRIKREHFLQPKSTRVDCRPDDKNQIPTMRRHRARNQHNPVPSQQRIAKRLLAGTGNARPQPVGIRNIFRRNDIYASQFDDCCSDKHVPNRVEGGKALVNRHLEHSGRRIGRAIDGADSPAVPSATAPVRALATVPRRAEACLIEPPRYQFAAAKRRRQRRHV
jgi:hypothetical protein